MIMTAKGYEKRKKFAENACQRAYPSCKSIARRIDRVSDFCSGDSANWKREPMGSANARRASGRRGVREETFAAPLPVPHKSRMRPRGGESFFGQK